MLEEFGGEQWIIVDLAAITTGKVLYIMSIVLARDLGVNISGIAIILQMRERMEIMQKQMQEFVSYIQEEVMHRAHSAVDPHRGAIVPIRRNNHEPQTPGKDRKR